MLQQELPAELKSLHRSVWKTFLYTTFFGSLFDYFWYRKILQNSSVSVRSYLPPLLPILIGALGMASLYGQFIIALFNGIAPEWLRSEGLHEYVSNMFDHVYLIDGIGHVFIIIAAFKLRKLSKLRDSNGHNLLLTLLFPVSYSQHKINQSTHKKEMSDG